MSIPNKAIYQGSYVYVVDDNILKRKNISIAWQSEDVAVIKSGLEVDELLVLTPLGQVTSGTIVSINSIDGKPVKAAKKTREKANADKRREKRPEKNGGSKQGEKQAFDDKGAKS